MIFLFFVGKAAASVGMAVHIGQIGFDVVNRRAVSQIHTGYVDHRPLVLGQLHLGGHVAHLAVGRKLAIDI